MMKFTGMRRAASRASTRSTFPITVVKACREKCCCASKLRVAFGCAMLGLAGLKNVSRYVVRGAKTYAMPGDRSFLMLRANATS